MYIPAQLGMEIPAPPIPLWNIQRVWFSVVASDTLEIKDSSCTTVIHNCEGNVATLLLSGWQKHLARMLETIFANSCSRRIFDFVVTGSCYLMHSCGESLQRSYEEAINAMTEGSSQRDRGTNLGRDDRIHGSLLIINELIMNSAWSDEVCVCSYIAVPCIYIVCCLTGSSTSYLQLKVQLTNEWPRTIVG